MNDTESYAAKLAKERAWYGSSERAGLAHRILRSSLVYSLDRVKFNYVFPKEQLVAVMRRHLSKKAETMLIVPCGTGDDFRYVADLADCVYGVDLSEVAVRVCPRQMNAAVGDALTLPYRDGMFDLVVCSLFFHHFLRFGFEPFLREYYRVLKPGGVIVILEPNQWYPLNIVTRPIKRVFSNPYGEVEDERPFPPGLLVSSLKETGFRNVATQAATFSHPAFYKPLANFVNLITKDLLAVNPLKQLGWLIVFWGEKAGASGQSQITAGYEPV